MSKKVKLKVRHSKNCWYKNRPNEAAFWHFSDRVTVFASATGNEKKGVHTWLEFVCTDSPNCPATVIVRLEALANWIHQELKK